MNIKGKSLKNETIKLILLIYNRMAVIFYVIPNNGHAIKIQFTKV